MLPMTNSRLFCFFVLVLVISGGMGSRILLLSVFGAKSTMINLQHLAEKLIERGHEIVYISRERTTDKPIQNMTFVLLPLETEIGDNAYQKIAYSDHLYTQFPFHWSMYLSSLVQICNGYYERPEILQLLTDKKIFDLVIFDFLLQDCLLPFVHSLKAPIIFLHGNQLDSVISSYAGISSPYSYVLTIFYQPALPMTFWNCIQNILTHLELKFIHEYQYYPKIEAIARHHLPDSPTIVDIFRNVSLIMATQDNIWTESRPLTPSVVDIGGLHCHAPSPLPSELQDVINDFGKKGFILFSMGTFLKSEFLPRNYLQAFLNVFSKLDQLVLWKYDQSIENLPPNVKTYKWLPQQDLLGHPNIQLFITHGGMYSLYEAIYHDVPVLGIGIFGDQMDNLRRAAEKGIGVSIDKHSVSEETIYQGIVSILNNSSYKNNMHHLSTVFKNQPETPLQRAVYWVEYVIRHKDISFLHQSAKELNFIQHFLLIEISILLTICLVIIYITYFMFGILVKKLLLT